MTDESLPLWMRFLDESDNTVTDTLPSYNEATDIGSMDWSVLQGVSGWEELDESAVLVSEEDLNDPEYLAQLGQLGDLADTAYATTPLVAPSIAPSIAPSVALSAGDSTSSNGKETAHTLLEVRGMGVSVADMHDEGFSEELRLLEQDESEPSSSHITRAERVRLLKTEALALSMAGNKTEAIEKLREAKREENDGSAEERRVQQVIDICATPSSLVYEDEECLLGKTQSCSGIAVSTSSSEPCGTAVQAKQRALDLRKANNINEALRWMKYAKSVQDVPKASMEKSDRSDRSDQGVLMRRYDELEAKLSLARNNAYTSAKAIKSTNANQAANKMRLLKKYEEELARLQNIRENSTMLPPCPSCRETKVKTSYRVDINSDIGDDGFNLSIRSLGKFHCVLSSYIGYSLSIEFSLGVPIDTPIEGKTPKVKITKDNVENVKINFLIECVVKRKNSFAKILQRKKVRFAIVLHRGFLQSSITLGVAYLSLADLVHSNESTSDCIEIVHESSGKAIGGSLSAGVSIRYPYAGNGTVTMEETVLEIDNWPVLTDNWPVLTCTSTSTNTSSTVSGVSGASGVNLSAKEQNDPLNADMYVSSDVMDKEIATLQSKLVELKDSGVDASSEIVINTKLRYDVFRIKLAVLVARVEKEELTVEQYLSMLREATDRDKTLALYCSNNGRKDEALEVMRRVLIMEKEIKSAVDI